MNGKRAKRLRRLVYGDGSLKQPRAYVRTGTGQVRNVERSDRNIYQQAKKLTPDRIGVLEAMYKAY